jgi:hypothetical protein
MPDPDPSPDPRAAERGCIEAAQRPRLGRPGRGERSRGVSPSGPVISVAAGAARRTVSAVVTGRRVISAVTVAIGIPVVSAGQSVADRRTGQQTDAQAEPASAAAVAALPAPEPGTAEATVLAIAAMETALAARLDAGRDRGQGGAQSRRCECQTFHGVIYASGARPGVDHIPFRGTHAEREVCGGDSTDWTRNTEDPCRR